MNVIRIPTGFLCALATFSVLFTSKTLALNYSFFNELHPVIYFVGAGAALFSIGWLLSGASDYPVILIFMVPVSLLMHFLIFFSGELAIYFDKVSSMHCIVDFKDQCNDNLSINEYIDYLSRHVWNQRLTKDGFLGLALIFTESIIDGILNIIPALIKEAVLFLFYGTVWIGYVCLFIDYIYFFFLGCIAVICFDEI